MVFIMEPKLNDEEINKKVDELAELLARIFIVAIDEGQINNQLNKKDNEKGNSH